MDTLRQDLVYALRGLRRSPGFALLALATLGLGIGANTAIFSVVHGAVLKPLPYPEPSRLYFISSQFPRLGFDRFWVSPPEFAEFRQFNSAFERVGAYNVGAANLGAERPIRPVTATVSEDLFPTLGVAPARGRGFTAKDTAPGAEHVLILSHELWQSAFGGDPGVIGRLVPVDGVKAQVVGIMPPGFDVHDEKVELWRPLTVTLLDQTRRGNHFLFLIGRLKPGVSERQANDDLDRLLQKWPTLTAGQHVPDATNHRLQIHPLQQDMVGGATTAAGVLQAAVGLVLLIACTNLASLLLARAERRQREYALRAALGAGHGRLLRQFLTEGLVLSAGGGALGIAFAFGALRLLVAYDPGGIPRIGEIAVDGTVLAFTVIVTLVTGLVFGLVPLVRLSRRQLHAMLQDAGARAVAGGARRLTRGALVVAEVALAVVLVVGAGLLLRTFQNLMRVDPGFNRGQLVTFGVVLPAATYPPADRPAFFDRLIARLEQQPGVTRAAAAVGLPPLRRVDANDTDFEDIVRTPDSQGPAENVDFWQGVSVGYLDTMGIPVVEGRGFEATDIEGAPVVLVNETLARTFFPGRSPVGRRLRPGFNPKLPWFTIVGVVRDVKQSGLGERTGTELYLLSEQLPRLGGFGYGNMNLVVRASLPVSGLAPAVQRIVRDLDPTLPVVALRSMDDVFTETVSRPRFLAALVGVFAGVALLLAAVGAYGILSYLVSERQREIGVRMAVGAGRQAVLRLVLGQGLGLLAIGLAVGLGGALAVTRLLESLLFGVRPADPTSLTAGAVFMAVVGAAACLVPAWRATRVNPIEVLRAE